MRRTTKNRQDIRVRVGKGSFVIRRDLARDEEWYKKWVRAAEIPSLTTNMSRNQGKGKSEKKKKMHLATRDQL